MLRAARRSFHEPDVRTVTKKVGLSFLKVFRTVYCKLDQATDTFRIRHLRNLLVKLSECRKLETHGCQGCFEHKCLLTKIVKYPLYDKTLSLDQNIQSVQCQLKQERISQKQTRISQWKSRLQQSSRRCFRWLKNPHIQPFRGLISSALDQTNATSDYPESLLLIRDHWRLVWKREPPDADAILERMREELALQNLPIHDSDWDPLCPVEIAMRAKFFAGKAAGPDGWSGNEIATMPIAVFEIFAKFCQLCEASGLLPSTWQIARQAHLPKGQKGVRAHDSARDVSGH